MPADNHLTNGTINNDQLAMKGEKQSGIGSWLFSRSVPQNNVMEVDHSGHTPTTKTVEKALTRTLSPREKRDCAVIGGQPSKQSDMVKIFQNG